MPLGRGASQGAMALRGGPKTQSASMWRLVSLLCAWHFSTLVGTRAWPLLRQFKIWGWLEVGEACLIHSSQHSLVAHSMGQVRRWRTGREESSSHG
jgi:hypothetical protein